MYADKVGQTELIFCLSYGQCKATQWFDVGYFSVTKSHVPSGSEWRGQVPVELFATLSVGKGTKSP